MGIGWIEPDWPAPQGIRAVTTLRAGGVSAGPFDSLNLAAHVGDEEEKVAANRTRLKAELGLPADPLWLEQVHGVNVVHADAPETLAADASWTSSKGVICAVMTADCLPVLLCNPQGEQVAAIHAGWRGLLSGVIEATLETMDAPESMAWLGPAIGPEAFEVGGEVRAAFLDRNTAFEAAFRQTGDNTWMADIYALSRTLLRQAGVTSIYGGGECTVNQPGDYFSYRRDRQTGRMVSLIWRE